MSRLVSFVLSPGGVVSVLFVAAAWVALRPTSRLARRSLMALAAGYLLASTYGVSYAVSRILTLGLQPFEASDLPPGTAAIVVMGSGGFTSQGWDDRQLTSLDPASASRVLEAARVFRLTDARWVISSGGNLFEGSPHEPNGRTMRDTLERLGVPADRLLVETESQTTRMEAVIVAPMLRSLNVAHAVLVTTDTHMRRALGAFRAEGIDAIPAIARDPFPAAARSVWFPPSAGGLVQSALLAHELLGLVYYGARGWWVPAARLSP